MKKTTRFSFTIAMFLITINSFAANFYWVNGSGNWSDTSHWAFSSGGTIFHSQWPGGTDNVFFDANSFSSPGQIVTLDQGITNCADMTWTTLPTAFPVLYGDSSKTFRIYGSLTIATVIGFNFNGQVIMEAMTTGKTITTSGTPINFHWTFNGAGGGWTFQDALMGSSVIDFINGTLNTNNQTINASAFYSTSGGVRTMIMGSSIFNLKGYNNALWNINPLGMTLNSGTSTINGTSTIGSGGNFYGGGLTYYNLSFADSAAIFGNNTFHDVAFVSDGFISGNNTFNDVSFFLHAIINGNSTFNNVIMSGNGNINGNNIFNNLTFSPWWTYTLQALATQTIGNICAQGTGALPIRIQSSSAGLPAIISKSSGTICWDYVRVSDITATGGAIFNAGLAPTNSQDLGGNTGLLFTGGCTAMSCLSSCNPPSITMQPINSSVCEGSNVVFAISATGTDLTYQWQANQGLGFVNLNNNTQYNGVTTNTLNITPANIPLNGYQYRCGAVGACPLVSMSNAATLTVKSSPTVTVNSPIICSGETAILTASAGTIFVPVAPLLPPSPPLPPPPTITSYIWSTGETTNPISVAPITNTSYTVTATTNGCSGTAIATVTVNPVPVITTTVSTSTVTVSATGGTPPYTGTGIFTGLAPGTYSYTVTDANGCAGSAIATVTEPESNCVTAIPINLNSCIYNNTLSGNEIWFSFIAGVTDVDVRLFDHSLAHHIGSIDWYEGSCTALILRGSVSEGIDSTINFIADNLINGNTYFIRIVRSSSCNSCTESLNFDLCLQTLLPYVCNPIAIPCGNLIQNPGFELGTPPVMFGGIGENYVNCWKSCGPNYWDNTPDVMDIAANTNPQSLGFGGNCYQSTGSVGIPFNYYSNGQVFNRTLGSNRYACLYPTEGMGGAIFPSPLNKTYYIEFWTATSTCYLPAYPASTRFQIGSLYVDTPIPGSANFTLTEAGVWHKNSFCIDLSAEDVSNISQFCLTYSSDQNNNKRYFFDDFKMLLLADAGPPATICSGASVPLGPACPIDDPTITYTWTPANSGLTCYNCPNPIASPTSTTTYYVSVGGGGFDCSDVVDQVVITVNPLPVVTATPASQTICSGSTTAIVLSSSVPGTTFSWTVAQNNVTGNLAGNGSFIAQTLTAIGNTQGTAFYIITPTANDCIGAPIIVPITVKPTPVVTVISATVCEGQPAILTASGATTYSWSPGGATNNPFTVSTTTNTTYTVTGTTNGCSNYAVATITVLPLPHVSVNSPTTTICSGQTATLAASGAASYSWSPGGVTTNPITVSPTTTTTYTVTGTSNTNGCSNTDIATVTVTICPPQECTIPIDYDIAPGNNVSSAFPGLTYLESKTIRITGTFTINQNFEFSACIIIMAPNGTVPAKIIVANNAILTLSPNTHKPGTHIYGCPIMWTGIEVLNGGKIIDGKSSIEDALSAVKINQGGKGVFASAIFNRNLTGIELTSNNAAISPVTISGTIFTSRTLNAGGVISNYTSFGFWSNITNYAPENLKAPYTNIKGLYGIKATDVKNLNVGTTNVANNFNGFDKIMCGISLTRTNAKIYNNKFQYLLGYGILNGSPPNEKGYGIKASGAANGGYSITVGGIAPNQANSFYNTYTAIYVTRYKINKIIGNNIMNTQTGPFSPTVINYGSTGVSVLNPDNNNTIIVSNQTLIKNCETGIWVNRSPSANAIHTMSLQINDNYDPSNNLNPGITADQPSVNCPNCHCTNGIYVSDLVTTATSPPPFTWEIKTNTITEATNGIYLLNVKRSLAQALYSVTDNICGVRYSNTGNTNGIVAKGCKGLSLTLNHTKCNSTAAAILIPQGNKLTYGIYLESSNNMLVKCNKMDDAARSLVFQGTCTSVLTTNTNPTKGITQNTMYRAQDGFVLLSSGIIGTQGNGTTVASNNYWDVGSVFSNSQTFTETSGANTSSKLFMSSGASTFPTNNKTNQNQSLDLYLPGSGLNICSTTTPPSQCQAVRAMSDNPPGAANTTSYSEELKDMVEDSTQLPVYSNENHWMRKQFVYDELKNDSSLNNNNSLQNFYNSSNHNYAKFAKVADKISNGQYNAANAINNSIVTNNAIESNQQTVNTLILQELITPGYVYTASDTAALNAIAYQCPLAGGYAVYQARNLLMTFADNVIEFTDNCNEAPKRSMNTIKTNTDEGSQLFKLYPNPNNGNMLLDYSLNATDKGEIIIYDIAGKLIYKYGLDASANQIIISHTGFNNGIYFYKISVNGKIIKADKLLIVK